MTSEQTALFPALRLLARFLAAHLQVGGTCPFLVVCIFCQYLYLNSCDNCNGRLIVGDCGLLYSFATSVQVVQVGLVVEFFHNDHARRYYVA